LVCTVHHGKGIVPGRQIMIHAFVAFVC
jgi:hypothetical protein